MSTFKIGKTYKTKDHADALIVYIDESMIIGIVTPENGLRQAFCWRENGVYSDRRLEFMDLVVPEPVTVTLWINLYLSNHLYAYYSCSVPYSSEDIARENLRSDARYLGTFPLTFEVQDNE